MKALDKVEIEDLKEDGYSDKEIEIINYYQSTKEYQSAEYYHNRSYYSGPVINFLFGDDFVKYNRISNQIEVYTQFGLVELPVQLGFSSTDRVRIEVAFNIAYKIKGILQSEKFYECFFNIISNENLKEDLQEVVGSRYDVYNSSIVNLSENGYYRIMCLIDSCLDNIDIESLEEKIGKNKCLPLNFYGARWCILDALKKRLNLEYTEDLNIHLFGE